MKYVILTRGMKAKVDDADYESLAAHKWCVRSGKKGCYAIRKANKRIVGMHNAIVNPPPGMVVDHINGDGLDNRRENLRACTPKENSRNSRHGRGVSKFKGVQLRRNRGKRNGRPCWIAVIRVDRQLIYIGQFDSEADAAEAYDRAAANYFGEFARPNFPLAVTASGARP